MENIKIGNFVRDKIQSERIIKVNAISLDTIPQYVHDSKGNHFPLENAILWTPNKDEYCCFGDKESRTLTGCGGFIVGQFAEYNKDRNWYLCKNNGVYYDYCEPYIGNFPDFLPKNMQ